MTPLPPGYAYQTCGLCNGVGKGALGPEVPCPPCKATGKVLVHQPPLTCPRCRGNGFAPAKDEYKYDSGMCAVCLGAGWVLTLAI